MQELGFLHHDAAKGGTVTYGVHKSGVKGPLPILAMARCMERNWEFCSRVGCGLGTSSTVDQALSLGWAAGRAGVWNRTHAFRSAPCSSTTTGASAST